MTGVARSGTNDRRRMKAADGVDRGPGGERLHDGLLKLVHGGNVRPLELVAVGGKGTTLQREPQPAVERSLSCR